MWINIWIWSRPVLETACMLSKPPCVITGWKRKANNVQRISSYKTNVKIKVKGKLEMEKLECVDSPWIFDGGGWVWWWADGKDRCLCLELWSWSPPSDSQRVNKDAPEPFHHFTFLSLFNMKHHQTFQILAVSYVATNYFWVNPSCEVEKWKLLIEIMTVKGTLCEIWP